VRHAFLLIAVGTLAFFLSSARKKTAVQAIGAVQACATNDENARASIERTAPATDRTFFAVSVIITV